MRRRGGNPGLRGRLLEKSIEAYILSLETINRLSIKYRVESFCYLLCNAWELLLKAKIMLDTSDRTAIYDGDWKERRRKGLPPHTIRLSQCIDHVFPNESDPIRRNLFCVSDLRNEASHLIISQLPKDVLSLFQACVLNYHHKLEEWFAISLSDRVTVGMMTIVYDLEPQLMYANTPRMRKLLGKDATLYLTGLQETLRQEAAALSYSVEFSVDIRVSAFISKREVGADVSLTSGPDGSPMRVVFAPKDSSQTHPFLQRDAIREINQLLSGKAVINSHDIHCLCRLYGIKKRPDFFYQGAVGPSPGQYSRDFIAWVVQQFDRDPEFFTRARDKQRTQLRQARVRVPAGSSR